jgi:molybdopterin converting factor small subunit
VKVIAHLHTILQKVTPGGSIRVVTVELDSDAKIIDLIRQMNLIIDEANTLFVIQGQIVEIDQKLFEGDEVHFIPAISGGGI